MRRATARGRVDPVGPRLDELVTRVGARATAGGTGGAPGVGEGTGAGGAPWVGVEHLPPGELRLDPGAAVGGGRPAERGDTAFVAGDLLVSRARPEQRKLALATFAGACSPELWVLRPRPGVDPASVLYALASPAVTAAWVAGAAGTGIPRVPWPLAAATRLPLLPVATVAHLATLDEAIAVRARVLAAVEGLLRAAAGGASFPEAGGAEAAGRMRVGDHAVEVRRLVAAGGASPDTPCVGLEHLSRGGLALSGWGRFGDARSEKVAFQKGDLLVGRLRPALHKLALAPVDGLASPDILVLRPRHPSGFALAVGALLDPAVPARLGARGRGTHMPRVRAADVLGLPAPALPPADAPDAPDAALAHAVAVAAELHHLRAVRDARLRAAGAPPA